MIKHLPLLLFIGLAFVGCQQEKNILSPENCIDESLISDDSVCYEIYAPVCGCNGETIQMIAMLELQVSQNGLKVNAIKVQNFTF